MHARHALALSIALCVAPADAHPPHDHGAAGAAPAARSAQTIAFLQDRLAKSPDDTAGLSRLGALQLAAARRSAEHADLAVAEATFRRLLALNPDSRTGRVGLAYSLLGQHRFREALEEAREIAHLEPDRVELWALLGDIHFALGNDAEAEAFFVRSADAGLTLESLSRMALMLQHRGRLSEADTAWHEALDAGRLLDASAGDLAWCHTMVGELDLFTFGDPEAAAAHFTAAVELQPASPVARRHLALIAMLDGQPARALDELSAVAEHHPRPDVWIALGRAHLALGQTDRAEALFDKAERSMRAELDAGDVGHVRELVELWLARGIETERAVELALGDLRDVRRDAGAFETAAWALSRAGRHDEAAEMIRAALSRSSADPRTLWRAGMIHEAAGRGDEARALRERARQGNGMIKRIMAVERPAPESPSLPGRG